jgi:hypothetical protein
MFEISCVHHVYNVNYCILVSLLFFSFWKCGICCVNTFCVLIFTHLYVHDMYRINDEIFIPIIITLQIR